MSTEQTQEPAAWGAPPPTPPRSTWTTRKIVVAVAIAVGIAAAGGVAIYAASGSVTADQGPGGNRQGGPILMGGPMGGMSGVDHGEFQTGEVTELTDDSITAKSDDGYTRTYVIDDETQLSDGVEKGDEVMVVASVDGTTATAKSVMEPENVQRRGGPQDGGPRLDQDSSGGGGN